MSRFRFFDTADSISAENNTESTKPVKETSDLTADKQARYRIEQQNLIKVDGNLVSSTLSKRQYLFNFNSKIRDGSIKLEESHLDFGNTTLRTLGYFINKTDEIKDEIKFSLNNKGHLQEITNQEHLKNQWANFKSNGLTEDPFIKELRNFDPQKVNDIIHAGNLEYSDFELMRNNLNSNLFYTIILDQYLIHSNYDSFQEENKSFNSHLFNTKIDLSFHNTALSHNENSITIVKKSNIVYANYHDIASQYEQNYQPTIQYAFTNFDYQYDQSVIINQQDGLIDSALATINESVKNNLESVVMFKLSRIKL